MPMQQETPYQRLLRRARRLVAAADVRHVRERLRGRTGIEIGGPSSVFRRWNLWPVYHVVGALDNYNFETRTIWSEQGVSFSFKSLGGRQPYRRQLIGEASVMEDMDSAAYQFLLASHVLEHIANPLKALYAWMRVVDPSGTIILVVPHRDGTFDHRRPITSINHIIADFEKDAIESDETHLQEILALHDLSHDPGAGTRAAFVARAKDNVHNRSLHHHVFDTELVVRLVDVAGLNILYVNVELPYHICVVCAPSVRHSPSPRASAPEANSCFWSSTAVWRLRSLFPSDRHPAGDKSSRTLASS